MNGLELLTVEQACGPLFMSKQGVRRLIKSGKLEAIKERSRVYIKPESVQAYIAAQPHPMPLMSALRYADFQLGVLQSIQRHGGMSTQTEYGFGQGAQFTYWQRIMPLLRELKEAIRARDYDLAGEIRHTLWQEYVDYEMLHRPVKAEQPRQRPPKPEWAMDLLFKDELN